MVRIFAVQLRNAEAQSISRRVEFIWDDVSYTTDWTADRPQWKDLIIQFMWEPRKKAGEKQLPATNEFLAEHIERLSKLFCKIQVWSKPDASGKRTMSVSPRSRGARVVGGGKSIELFINILI